MKQVLSVISIFLIVVFLCSCGNASVSSDPFVDLSLFDSNESDALSVLGEPTESDIGSENSEFTYEKFVYLGMTGELEFKTYADDQPDGDRHIRSMVFAYQYPGSYDWKRQDEYDEYSPNAEELKIAQEYWNLIVQHYNELFGTPVYQTDEKFVWEKEPRMEYSELIILERKTDKKAFSVFCTITRP